MDNVIIRVSFVPLSVQRRRCLFLTRRDNTTYMATRCQPQPVDYVFGTNIAPNIGKLVPILEYEVNSKQFQAFCSRHQISMAKKQNVITL